MFTKKRLKKAELSLSVHANTDIKLCNDWTKTLDLPKMAKKLKEMVKCR